MWRSENHLSLNISTSILSYVDTFNEKETWKDFSIARKLERLVKILSLLILGLMRRISFDNIGDKIFLSISLLDSRVRRIPSCDLHGK